MTKQCTIRVGEAPQLEAEYGNSKGEKEFLG